jgi:hypothetical protein
MEERLLTHLQNIDYIGVCEARALQGSHMRGVECMSAAATSAHPCTMINFDRGARSRSVQNDEQQ